jgi:hypothetical protein
MHFEVGLGKCRNSRRSSTKQNRYSRANISCLAASLYKLLNKWLFSRVKNGDVVLPLLYVALEHKGICFKMRPIHNISESAKIRGSITSRQSEEDDDDDMGAELLLSSVPIAEASVVLPPISPSSTNTTPVGLEDFVEGRIRQLERCSFTCQSYLCTVAA